MPGMSAKKSKNSARKDQNGDDKKKSQNQQQQQQSPMLPFVGILVCAIVLPQLGRFIMFGPTMLLGHAFFDLKKTPSEWRAMLDNNKTILTIGGPHRSGTTLIWDLLSAHPDLSSFGSQFRTGVSFSEGVLMQDIFPMHGVGDELAAAQIKEDYKDTMDGVGKYALKDEADVHLTESSDRVTPDNLARLLNRYGAYWDLDKPVWVDKSPTAAVMTRVLQALYNVNVDDNAGDKQGDHRRSPAKFLFTTRHPIANAYAHHHLLQGENVVPFEMLLKNYIKVHNYILEDLPYLENDPKLVKLEDFVLDPEKHLTDIFDWLGVDSSPAMVQGVIQTVARKQGPIRRNVNDKYRDKWCRYSASKRREMAEPFQVQIEALGLDYDLLDWCKG